MPKAPDMPITRRGAVMSGAAAIVATSASLIPRGGVGCYSDRACRRGSAAPLRRMDQPARRPARALAEDDEAGTGAATATRWPSSDGIKALLSQHMAGHAAKARVAIALLTGNGRDDQSDAGGDEQFALATLRYVAGGGAA